MEDVIARILRVRANAWENKDLGMVGECDEQLRAYGWSHTGPIHPEPATVMETAVPKAQETTARRRPRKSEQ